MLIDHHCHLDFPGFDEDRAAVVARARAAGVGLIVCISTKVRQLESLRTAIATYPNVYHSVGTHPHHAHTELDISADDLKIILQRNYAKVTYSIRNAEVTVPVNWGLYWANGTEEANIIDIITERPFLLYRFIREVCT